MRELTNQEKELLQHRKNGFDKFLEERMPVLKEFAESLEIPDAYKILLNAEDFISPISNFLIGQTVDDEDRNWILTRIGYFLGEYFVQKYGGYWFVDETVDSKSFGRYVVGDFDKLDSEKAIDSFELAKEYIDSLPGGDLKNFIDKGVLWLED